MAQNNETAGICRSIHSLLKMVENSGQKCESPIKRSITKHLKVVVGHSSIFQMFDEEH